MAEAIPYGTVSNILSKLVWLAGQELGFIFGLNKDLEKLQQTLSTINAVLRDAEEKQESNHAVENWIIRLEDVVFDAEDLLDEFDYAILRQKVRPRGQVCKFFSSSNPLVFGHKMGHRFKEIRERLDAVAADIFKFNLTRRVVVLDSQAKKIDRETASKVRSELIIGREKEKEHIIESLLKEQIHGDSISNIVAIVGFGGLGKTSLARMVYNDARVTNFSKRIWVCVSEEFNVYIIFKKILKSLVDDKVDDLDLDKVQQKLEEKLEGERYLLVLDDVWNEDASKWNDFCQYLVFGASGSKILVTTRSKIVASTMGVQLPYVLEGLNDDQSWALFKQVAFQGQCQIDPKLREIGKDVAQRCKGVPLAIKCLGGLMRQKPNEKYWLSVEENEMWKLLKEDDGVFPVLRLSYIHLPSHLKQCFAICSIFPKDCRISKNMLIHLWRAQGYIQQMENEDIQDIGDEYFNDLFSRSFFQEEKRDETGNIISCKMHDLIHDLALLVAKCSFYLMKVEKEKIPKGVRHVSLKCKPSEMFLTRLSKAKGIRTMYFWEYTFQDLFIQNIIFSRFNYLRMLNLRYMDIDILPNSIEKLKHLRYLDLSYNYQMEVLSDAIVKLHKLQTLLLYACSKLKELPRDIRQLIGLEYLNIDQCNGLRYLPKGLGELTSLQTLHRFIVNSFSTAATLNELRDLNLLGNCLSIENLGDVKNAELESMEANLKTKKRLQSLKLDWWTYPRGDNKKDELLLDNLQPHPNLKKLEVLSYEGAKFSAWLSSLNNLIKLQICISYNCQHLPPLHHLSSLECLILEYLKVLEHVADDGKEDDHPCPSPCSTPKTSFFPSLKILKIRGCLKLKGWWRTKNENQGSTVELPWFPCLSKLEIEDCQNLTSMPLFPFLDHDLTLKGTSVRPLQQTLKMKMTKASMTSEASSSRSTCHSYSYSSTALPLSNLKRLTLDSVNGREGLSQEFLKNLTSLVYLKFKYDCQSLPQKMTSLTSLQELRIEYCPNLRVLPDWIPNLSSLRTLKIWYCPELQYLPEGMHRLTSLQKLSIRGCPQLSERCKKETGIHWPHIAHIPSIHIEMAIGVGYRWNEVLTSEYCLFPSTPEDLQLQAC